jgi:hypothetical protein
MFSCGGCDPLVLAGPLQAAAGLRALARVGSSALALADFAPLSLLSCSA